MKLKLLVLMLVILPIAYAEEVTLLVSDEVKYKEIPIRLVSIGTLGSALLEVDGDPIKLSKNEKRAINNLDLTILESSEDAIVILVEKNVECIINEDCQSKDSCNQGICSQVNECAYKAVSGCPIGNECKPAGSLAEISGNLKYCSQEFEWVNRRDKNEACAYNYECLSSVCEDGQCTKPSKRSSGGERMAPVWLVILFGAVFLIKGIFIVFDPRQVKTFIRELSYIKDSKLKFIGFIAILIGIILIIWAFI